MKKRFYIIILILSSNIAFSQDALNIMTFNIRYNNTYDSLNAWPKRKVNLCSEILFHKADILGVQEALADQMTDMQTALKDYSYVGVGRDDG